MLVKQQRHLAIASKPISKAEYSVHWVTSLNALYKEVIPDIQVGG
jgi:hypothetical protein